MMRDGYFIKLIATILILVGCSQSTNLLPTLTNSGITKEVIVVDYPPIEWQVNGEKLNDLGCDNKVQ
ncbi:MAG: hypothetical protein JXR84_10895, partial [Anaerolineae bacterium]|nr:hypothetical protein [Anaerolineae bacterium]